VKETLDRKDGIKKIMKEFMSKRKEIVLLIFVILDIYNMDSYALILGQRKKELDSA